MNDGGDCKTAPATPGLLKIFMICLCTMSPSICKYTGFDGLTQIQGDLWEVTIVILLYRIEKLINRTNKKCYTRVYIGRFDYLP